MPIPESYRVQEMNRRCENCAHADELNHIIYCRRGERAIMALLMEYPVSHVAVIEQIRPTTVDRFGICDEYK